MEIETTMKLKNYRPKGPIELDQSRPAWEQQEGEPFVDYNQFVAFLRLGFGRNLLTLYSIHKREEYSRTHGTLHGFIPPTKFTSGWRDKAAIFRWYDRAEIFDRENNRLLLGRTEDVSDEEVKRARSLRLSIAWEMLEKIQSLLIDCQSAHVLKSLAKAYRLVSLEQRTDMGIDLSYYREKLEEATKSETLEFVIRNNTETNLNHPQSH